MADCNCNLYPQCINFVWIKLNFFIDLYQLLNMLLNLPWIFSTENMKKIMYTIASICLPGSYLHDFRLDQTLFKNSSTLFNEKKVLKNSILGQGFFFYIPKIMLLTVEHIQYDVAERKYQNLFVLEPNSNQLY